MLIHIERSQTQANPQVDGHSTEKNGKPSLPQALWGGLTNLVLKRPLLALFRVNLRFNSSCGYCNLPLNEGRYEMSQEEIRNVFASPSKDGLRFMFV